MAIVGRLFRFAVLLVLLVVMFGGGWAVGRLGLLSTVPVASLSDRERQFTERMQGASLVGYFTVSGRTRREPEEDRYDISSVEKVADDRWRFNVRMRHGTYDVTLPVVVPMKWVDDTPVVTLTDWEIPKVGTFTCRVLFHGDRYAGTWQHGATGGLMYGRIEQAPKEDQPQR
jgi:hypothetical protein